MEINLLTSFDILYSIILFFIILSYSNSVKKKNIVEYPYYKNYSKGLIIKLLGAILFCGIYALHYKGGDTVNYYKGIRAMMIVLSDSPSNYIELLFRGNDSISRTIYENIGTYPPIYMFKDYRTYTVIKICSFFALPGLGGFMSTTILLSFFVYRWIWKLYTFIIERYPDSEREINIALLFLPSTIFWGSGIMKDTLTFAATCFAIYGLHKFFIRRKKELKTVVGLVFSFYIIFTVKSYIAFALLPGLLIFMNFERLKRIKSIYIKLIAIPAFTTLAIIILNTLFVDFDSMFGKYSADRIFEEAATQNADLQRSVYGTNSFDIGEFEPTIVGVLNKFLPAINAALLRPYIWEAGGSPTMIFSGIETLLILLLTIRTLITRPFGFIKNVFADPFLLFCLLFTTILGFGVGLSTSNFGALVRYKIPYLPFFVLLLLIGYKKVKKPIQKKVKESIQFETT